jgi:flagellar motor switch protein FliN
MSEPLAKQLTADFIAAWGEAAPELLGRPSTLALLSEREVTGESVSSALSNAAAWSAGFAAPCTGGLPGVVVCLLKAEDSQTIDRLAQQIDERGPVPSGLALTGATLAGAARRLTATAPAPITFGGVIHLDLRAGQSSLAEVVGNTIWIHTLALSVGDDLDSQVLLIYAPNGSLESELAARPAAGYNAAAPPPLAPAARSREGHTSRNIERLLDVELEVIVRFGVTNMLLRDVVRLGTGTMIELNRAVDEPVELLVNGQPLARGEVVVVDGYYGVRITEISTLAERAATLK